MSVSTPFTPPKRVGKSILSMYLRTKCDRELYLSLHKASDLRANGMPEPLSARPDVSVMRQAGLEFEKERNQELVHAFGQAVLFRQARGGGFDSEPLMDQLSRAQQTPFILLQPKMEIQGQQVQFLSRIGVDPGRIQLIPPIEGFIPDLIVARVPIEPDEEVLSNGTRMAFDPASDSRVALHIIDIKHTSSANASYRSEVALYAIILANWLEFHNLQSEYYVSAQAFLRIRFEPSQSALAGLIRSNPSASPLEKIDALFQDCESAWFRYYLPVAVRFFREDIPRVVAIGDARPDGWRDLEWHVGSRCSSCDWLGIDKWVSRADQAKLNAHPDHYCYKAAELSGHLSRIPGMTRGGRKTLESHNLPDVSTVAASTGLEPAYQEHTMLKRESDKLPLRAGVLQTGSASCNTGAVLTTLMDSPKVYVSIVVNFDPSSGLLTSLNFLGTATTYQKGLSPLRVSPTGFVVDDKSEAAEWNELRAFLENLASFFQRAEDYLKTNGTKDLSNGLPGQVVFWERRQYEELCKAMGRHLLKVLALSDRHERALAWLFPAEELLEKDGGALSPCIVFIEDIVRRVVFAPTPHAITLFDTVEHYHDSYGYPPVQRDVYYREILSSGIPRERIYEIWSKRSSIQRGSMSTPRNSVIAEFSQALGKQVAALDNVTKRLRSDFWKKTKGSKARIKLSIPRGVFNVAFDAKLWIQWDELEHAVNHQEALQLLALDALTLEANHDAILLFNGRQGSCPGEYEYDVGPGSTEVKFDDDQGFLTVGKQSRPGFPLEKVNSLLPNPSPVYGGNEGDLYRRLHSALGANLISFDRMAKRATVRFQDTQLFQYLIQNNFFNPCNDLFLVKSPVLFNWAEKTRDILVEIGNPSIATADPNALRAMGTQAVRTNGSHPVRPAARVLWDAGNLHSQQVLPASLAKVVASYADSRLQLNPSQIQAIERAASYGLTIIWGPPGTGKTRTLAGYILGLAHLAVSRNESLKILITAQTYKAVEELVDRVIAELDKDPSTPADVFAAYSSSRTVRRLQQTGQHLKARAMRLQPGTDWDACNASLSDPTRVTIVATGVQQAYKFAEFTTNQKTCVAPVFDVVVLDESSQISVTKALSALATLKDESRLVVAGDHLQMPPILALDPPVNAEYLVGSIQKYLLNRQFSAPVKELALDLNYRSCEQVVAFARSIGYPQTLRACHPNLAIHLRAPLPTPATGYPSSLPWSPAWVDILEPSRSVLTLLHEDDRASQNNRFEAQIVAGLVWSLWEAVSSELDGHVPVNHQRPTMEVFWQKVVGVVTPHRAQRAMIVQELRTLFPTSICPQGLIEEAVDTVEKFQGGERHVILVSFGVADVDVIAGEEAFLMQFERINVAISRAQAKCVVLMPNTLANHVPEDKRSLETADAITGYVHEFCNNRQDIKIFHQGAAVRAGQLRWHT